MSYSKEAIKYNNEDTIYLNGNEYTDGSRRLVIDADTNFTTIEKRVDGIWQPTSFETSPDTMWVGRNVGVAGIGHHLATESSDGHLHFHAHSEFNGEISQTDTKVLHALNFLSRTIFQPDNTGNWIGTSFDTVIVNPSHSIQKKAYLQTHTTGATQPVRIQVWEGYDDQGTMIFDQTYPASIFIASSEIEINTAGYLEFDTATAYMMRLSSDANFSLKTNSGITTPWFAVDMSPVTEDSILQTTDYVDGSTYTDGQYLIDSRKIYVCNVAGVQTGTFASNSDKWDLVSDRYINSLLTEGSVAFASANGKLTEDNAKLFWDNTNKRLGIGTKTPSESLQIFQGNIRVEKVILDRAGGSQMPYIQKGSAGSNKGIGFYITDVEKVCILESGNVGIGITNPGSKLDVVGDVKISDDLIVGTNVFFIDKSNGSINLGSAVTGTDRLNVFSPTTGVQTGIASFYDSSSNIKFRIRDEWTASSIPPRIESQSSLGFALNTTNNAPFIWYVNGTGNEKMRLTSTGLGIGKTPSYKLDVAGQINCIEIMNSDGDLKIQPDVQGDVILFGDTDVGDAENSKMMYVRRQAVEGDDYIRLYVSNNKAGIVSASSDLTVYAVDSVTLQSDGKDVIFRMGDDAGAKGSYFKNSSNAIVGSVDSLGNAQFDASIDVPEIYNSAGDLKIQPDVQGDVVLFGDTDVANNENSPYFYIHRKAPEGDTYIRLFVNSSQRAYIHGSPPGGFYMQGQADMVVKSVTEDVMFIVGDNAGVKKFRFRDIDNNDVMTLDSDAYLNLFGNMLVEGVDGFDSASETATIYLGNTQNYLNVTHSGNVKLHGYNGVDISDDDGIIATFEDGRVGIGKVADTYPLEILAQTSGILLENSRTIMGMGYGVGELIFSAGESSHLTVAQIRVGATEDWTASSSPTRMSFYTTKVGATTAIENLRLDEKGNVAIGSRSLDLGHKLAVDGGIHALDTFVFSDGSTQPFASTPDSRGWHVTTAILKQSKDISTQDTSPRDMHFSSDGKKLYVSGVAGNGTIYEYNLTTPWDISTLTYNSNSLNVNTYESNPMGLFFRQDGKKVYVCGSGGDEVNEFDLSTAWDITSGTWNALYDLTATETQPAGIEFRPDGLKMYIIGTQGNDVNEYDLSIAWDITTATWLQLFGTSIDAPTGFTFKPDGTKMYVMDGSAEDDIHEYNLTTPWDISTASLERLFDVSSENLVPQDIAFTPDGAKMYMLGSSSPASVFEYDLGVLIEGGNTTIMGNLRIGIDEEDAFSLPLEVFSADNLQAIFFDSTAQAQGVGGGIAFGGKYTDAGAEALAGKIETEKANSTSGHIGFNMVFETQDSVGSITERMILTHDGMCGIGDISPTKTLDINGDTRIRGDLTVDSQAIIGNSGAISASACLELKSTTGALLVPRMTSTQRNALTAVNGMIIYDTTQNAFRKYQNGAWASF